MGLLYIRRKLPFIEKILEKAVNTLFWNWLEASISSIIQVFLLEYNSQQDSFSFFFSWTLRNSQSRVCLFLIYLFIYLFIYLWLCWVFVSVRGLSLVVASGGHSSSRCVSLSLSRPLLLWSTGSRRAGSVVVAHEPSCSAACGIFPDQGSNPCPCIGRQVLNHCTTREAPIFFF